MVMQNGNKTISIDQDKEVEEVFSEVAKKQNANLEFIQPDSYKDISVTNEYVEFTFQYKNIHWENLKLHMLGDFQAGNSALALFALIFLSERDNFKISEEKVRKTLATISYPGRFEIKQYRSKTLVIDGAHNVQKMTALLSNLKKVFPEQKYTFIVAFKEDKEIEAMVQLITPLAEKVIVTSYFNDTVDFVTFSENPEIIADLFRKYGCKDVSIQVSKEAVSHIENIHSNIVVVTGSLYLLSDIYPNLSS
jgi:dihydrofolate synthase/folylpolyglutamate synthase